MSSRQARTGQEDYKTWKRKWDDDAQEQALAEMRKEKEAKEEAKKREKDEGMSTKK